MHHSTPRPAASGRARQLHVVADVPAEAERASAPRFSETVRTVVTLARRRGLRPPVFRSPPRLAGVDRTIRRRPNGAVVVAVRRGDRPMPAVQADVIEGVVAANGLGGEQADRFRHEAWAALDGRPDVPRRRASMDAEAPPARVA